MHVREQKKIHIVAPGKSLLAEVAVALAGFEPRDWPDIAIFVPTQRMILHLLASLTEERTTALTPRCWTLDQWVLQSFADSRVQVLSSWQEEVHLEKLLQKGGFRHLQAGHAGEIRQLFHEFETHELPDSAWNVLARRLRDDVYHDEAAQSSFLERLEELAALQSIYRVYLQSLGLTTNGSSMRQALQRAEESVANWGDACPFAGILLAGFTSLQPGPRRLFAHLAERPQSQCFLSQPPIECRRASPIAELIQQLKLPLARQPTEAWTGAIAEGHQKSIAEEASHQVVSCTNPVAESTFVATQVRQLLTQGVPASQLAVLVTDERLYPDLLRQALAAQQIVANFGMGMPLRQTMLGGALSILSSLQQTDRLYASCLVSALHHPLLARLLQEALAYASGAEFEAARSHLVRELPNLGIVRTFFDLLAPSLSAASSQFLRRIQPIFIWGGQNSSPQSAAEWESAVSPWLVPLYELHARHYAERDVEQGAIELSRRYFSFFRTAATQTPCTSHDWWRWWQQHLLETEVRTVGEPLSGVQVLSLDEARYVPFACTFVLGAQDGSLPRALPKDELIDDYSKRLLGLPGWAALEALEEQNFWLLLQRSPQTVFTHSRQILGSDKGCSHLLQQALDLGRVVVRYEPTDHSWLPIHSVQEPLEPPPPPGMHLSLRPDAWMNGMSATSLERFLHCPLRFALERNRWNPLDLPTGELRPAQEGQWLHRILEEFFTADDADLEPENPDWPFEKKAEERLRKLTQRSAPPGALQSPFYLHLYYFAWPHLTRHLERVFRGDWLRLRRQRWKEVQLTRPEEEGFPATSHESRRGSIDSIDDLGSILLLTDYKRGGTAASSTDVRRGVMPQLAFYAQAIADGWTAVPTARSTDLVAGYWSAATGTWLARMVDENVRSDAIQLGLATPHTPTVQTATEAMRELLTWRLQTTQNPDGSRSFPADPSRCSHCPHDGVCRRDDATFTDVVDKQDLLAQRFSADAENGHEVVDE